MIPDCVKVSDYLGQPVRWAQAKADGVRVVLSKGDDGAVSALSRSGRTDYWPRLEPRLGALASRLPACSVLDAELHVPGTQSSDAVAAAHAGRGEFAVHTTPLWGGEPVEDLDRGLGLAESAGFGVLAAEPIEDGPIDEAAWLARAIAEGIEGFVFKQSALHGWYRLKPVCTLDVTVIGCERSTAASFAGGIKSLLVADESGRELGRVGNGLSRMLRIGAEPSELLGRVAEVEFDSFTRSGKLRFPRFLRWRPDKVIPCGLFSSH